MNMPNNYYQNQKERIRKEAHLKYQNLLKKEKANGKDRFEKDIKIFLRN